MARRLAGSSRLTRLLSAAEAFPQAAGSFVVPGTVHGYYIDLRGKAATPEWPPRRDRPWRLHVGKAQWGLGAYERHVAGEGEEWLVGALAAGEQLLREQERSGPFEGGWVHREPYPHTYRVDPPWLSGIAQGQAASLLVRLGQASGEARFAEGARRALLPLSRPVTEGGLLTQLDEGTFPEEYPTDPPSLVLNGGIYALLGVYDVWIGLGDQATGRGWEEGVGTLARSLHRWDTGWWSLYDLQPRRPVNLASPWYHALHLAQLRTLALLAPHPELERIAARFERYAASSGRTAAALAHKAAFRALHPRRGMLRRRLRRLIR
jgi:heparosan-N-sulfate-glucuronate 5-epimerase